MCIRDSIPIVFFNREPVEEDLLRWEHVYYVGAVAEDSGVLQGEILLDYWNKPVSYTHLDVYKRQVLYSCPFDTI